MADLDVFDNVNLSEDRGGVWYKAGIAGYLNDEGFIDPVEVHYRHWTRRVIGPCERVRSDPVIVGEGGKMLAALYNQDETCSWLGRIFNAEPGTELAGYQLRLAAASRNAYWTIH